MKIGEGTRTAIECTQIDISDSHNEMSPHDDCQDARNVEAYWRTLVAWKQSYPLALKTPVLRLEHASLTLKLTGWLVHF